MLRRMMYFSLGALTLSQEKAEKFFNEMVEKGEMNNEEAKSFIDEAVEKGQEQKDEIRKMIKHEFESFKNELPFVSRSELKSLESRIAELENKLMEKEV